MPQITSPLKYHMNDLVYYLGMSAGGHLGKQIAYLGAISAMAKGMMYNLNPQIKNSDGDVIDNPTVVELDTFIAAVDLLDRAYVPSFDTNPYLFHKARRIRKGLQVVEALGYHILSENELIAGNIMRARLAEQFGKDRIMKSARDAQYGISDED
jgi:hypothetical protein